VKYKQHLDCILWGKTISVQNPSTTSPPNLIYFTSCLITSDIKRGCMEGGVEKPNVRVTLARKIPPEDRERLNLCFRILLVLILKHGNIATDFETRKIIQTAFAYQMKQITIGFHDRPQCCRGSRFIGDHQRSLWTFLWSCELNPRENHAHHCTRRRAGRMLFHLALLDSVAVDDFHWNNWTQSPGTSVQNRTDLVDDFIGICIISIRM
jgi:hypothetical protein